MLIPRSYAPAGVKLHKLHSLKWASYHSRWAAVLANFKQCIQIADVERSAAWEDNPQLIYRPPSKAIPVLTVSVQGGYWVMSSALDPVLFGIIGLLMADVQHVIWDDLD